MRTLGLRLVAKRFAQHLDVSQGLLNSRLKIDEIDRLCHSGADVAHVAIG